MTDKCESCGVPFEDHDGLIATCKNLQEVAKESNRLRAWIIRTATTRELLTKNAGYQARRVCLESQAILRGEEVPRKKAKEQNQ